MRKTQPKWKRKLIPPSTPMKCEGCGERRPYDPKRRLCLKLPFEWRIHTHRDDRLTEGRYSTLTCSEWCRMLLGYEERCAVPGCEQPYMGRGFCERHQHILEVRDGR